MEKSIRSFRIYFLIWVAVLFIARIFAEVELGPFSFITTLSLEGILVGTLTAGTFLFLLPLIQKSLSFEGSISSVLGRETKRVKPDEKSKAPTRTAKKSDYRPKGPPEEASTTPQDNLTSQPKKIDLKSDRQSSFAEWQSQTKKVETDHPWHKLRPERKRSSFTKPRNADSPPEDFNPKWGHQPLTPPSSSTGEETSGPEQSAKEDATLAKVNQRVPFEANAISQCLRRGFQESLEKMTGFAEILVNDHQEGLPENARLCLTKLQKNAKETQSILTDLLAYLEFDQKPLTSEPIQLESLIREVQQELSEPIREGQVSLKVSKNLPDFTGDRYRIKIILKSLMANAVKFHNKNERWVEVQVQAHKKKTVLTIRDNGIGIDTGEEKMIFEPFVRGLRAGLFHGTGLGLAMAHSAVQSIGGKIEAESIPGEGSLFRVVLPDNAFVFSGTSASQIASLSS